MRVGAGGKAVREGGGAGGVRVGGVGRDGASEMVGMEGTEVVGEAVLEIWSEFEGGQRGGGGGGGGGRGGGGVGAG